MGTTVDELAAGDPSVATTVAEVMVRGLTVQADIGVNLDEIGQRQPLVLDVTLRISVPLVDRLEATIDYREVVRAAESLADQRFALIETFARCLASACLQHPSVWEADVTIAKPRALATCMAMTRIVSLRTSAS